MAERKACTGCGEAKPLDDFYDDKRGRNGKRSECKACHGAKTKQWKRQNAEARRVADARFKAALPTEQKRAWSRAYVERHPDRRAEQLRRFRREHPEKDRAHKLLNTAVRQGKVQRLSICQWCGAGGRIEASHHDYTRPLDVLWLCVPCHRKRDRRGA